VYRCVQPWTTINFDFEQPTTMGVPKFYRWLSERYPRVNQLIEDGSVIPDIDHLYLDMNGVLHKCTHSDELSEVLSDEAVIRNLEEHLDRCISHIIKPKKSIFFAIDGVAPRAKLNQQRGRRFVSGRLR
jgi:5'-3' exoribonuclease 1